MNNNNLAVYQEGEEEELQHQPYSGSVLRYNSDERHLNFDVVEEKERAKNLGCFNIFEVKERLFKFRGTQLPAGQYAWNFTFHIPETKIPSSFQYISATGDSYSVKYSISVYFNEVKDALMTQSKEIKILSRAKAPRRNTTQDLDRPIGNGLQAKTRINFNSASKKDRDDVTQQNLDEMATPNKVGFDSIESFIGEPNVRMDVSEAKNNIDILNHSEHVPKHKQNRPQNLKMIEEESKFDGYDSAADYNTRNGLLNQPNSATTKD